MKNDFTIPAESLSMVKHLLTLPRSAIKSMYRELQPPAMMEVFGEYDAMMLSQGGRLRDRLTQVAFQSRGHWIGKAFRPLSPDHGQGYNAFINKQNQRYAKLPMDTYIGDSLVSRGKAFILDYRIQSPGVMSWLVGELRSVNPHILLGIGSFGPRGENWGKLRRKIPFLLVGPVRHYLGETGAIVVSQTNDASSRTTDRSPTVSSGELQALETLAKPTESQPAA